MGAPLRPPVHLYVKKHRITGLKYFGRTTQNPYTYAGSGAYWQRHLEKYGPDVETTIVGTFHDSSELRKAAVSFSEEHKIASSTSWANLLPEDGDVAGEGWGSRLVFDSQVAALDRAVEDRLARRRADAGRQSTLSAPERASEHQDKGQGPFLISLAIVSVVLGLYMLSNSRPGDGYADGFEFGQFILGALMGAITPIGWIPAAIMAWLYEKMSA